MNDTIHPMADPDPQSSHRYDYIILGAGCAGLSLLMRILDHPVLRHKKILLADRSAKSQNDRTWCFWEKGEGFFEDIVFHHWDRLWVRHANGNLPLDMGGYRYKMIRGIDFYRHAFGRIRESTNVTLQLGEVEAVDAENGTITCAGQTFSADHIFSSVMLNPPVLGNKDIYLLQHFRGWWITAAEAIFDPGQAELMNFNTSQQHGCAFVYVLPVSPRRALVEYTLFTADELTDAEYDDGLREFIAKQLRLSHYQISEVENGVIPMTNVHFPDRQGKVTFTGTAGGLTKSSTGYTFQNIQKHSAALVEALAAGNAMPAGVPLRRFRFYDSVLLRVLQEQKMPGADVFFDLFETNPAARVFRFLDNETRLPEELLILNSTPKMVFVPAAMKELHRLIT